MRVVAVLFALLAPLLPFALPLEGESHADWVVMLGRLHPILLHVPVALLGLAPALEVLGCFTRWRALRHTAGILLSLGAGGAIIAMLAGYALAYGSGMEADPVKNHMWGGVALTTFALLAWAARHAWVNGRLRPLYPILLLFSTGTLTWAAHMGGSLSHGETYLTDKLPAPIKSLLGIPVSQPSVADPGSAYTLIVKPVLETHCIHCHDAQKTKGGLRLDDFALMMKGGDSGPAIIPGKPEEGELLRRVTLPAGDNDIMPPDGKPLSKTDIEAIRAWIAAGASASEPPAPGTVIPSAPGHAAGESPQGPRFDPVDDYHKVAAQIREAEKKLGVTLVPVSRNAGDGVILRTRAVAAKFDDKALAALKPLAPFIVEVELGHTAVTDAAFDTLTAFKNIRVIHLDHTAVTGKGGEKLTALKKLTHLNLTKTKLTPAGFASVKSIKKVSAFDTPAVPTQPVMIPPALIEAEKKKAAEDAAKAAAAKAAAPAAKK